jgi:hypothetical protein
VARAPARSARPTLLALIAVQLAVGNGALVGWALAPARAVTEVVADFPAPFLTVGTVAPRDTATAALTFVGYAAVYSLVVQVVRTRRHVGRLVRTLLLIGGLMAFVGLVDYFTGASALARWRGHAFPARVSGTFANPDHFAAWLAMLIALGSAGWPRAGAAIGARRRWPRGWSCASCASRRCGATCRWWGSWPWPSRWSSRSVAAAW